MKPPALLVYAWQSRAWGALPEAGGLRDQPAGMLAKMSYLDSVYQSTKRYINAENAVAWADANPEQYETYAHARQLEMRMLNE